MVVSVVFVVESTVVVVVTVSTVVGAAIVVESTVVVVVVESVVVALSLELLQATRAPETAKTKRNFFIVL